MGITFLNLKVGNIPLNWGSVASVQDKYKSLIWTLFHDANGIKDLYVELLGSNS